jgi:hypothetical protein
VAGYSGGSGSSPITLLRVYRVEIGGGEFLDDSVERVQRHLDRTLMFE